MARCFSFEILRGRGCKGAAATALRLPLELELGRLALEITGDKVPAEAVERVIPPCCPPCPPVPYPVPVPGDGDDCNGGCCGCCGCCECCEWWLHVDWRRWHWLHHFLNSRPPVPVPPAPPPTPTTPLSILCGLLLGGGLRGDIAGGLESRLIVDPSIATSRDGGGVIVETATGPPTGLLVILLRRS